MSNAVVWHATGDVDRLAWWCPGCDTVHAVDLTRWTWNRSLEAPTLSPSVLSTGERRCHCFVREGWIKFLTDSDHRLAGKDVPMVQPPDWMQD